MPAVLAATSPADNGHRHRSSWVLGIVAVLFLLSPAVFTLPRQVNAVAYLADAGHPDTFIGYSHGRQCSQDNCTATTLGILANTGQGITWPGAVPLGKPVPVRDPVWRFGSSLVDDVPEALVGAGLGLVFDAIALFALAVFAVRARRLLAHIRAHHAAPSRMADCQ